MQKKEGQSVLPKKNVANHGSINAKSWKKKVTKNILIHNSYNTS